MTSLWWRIPVLVLIVVSASCSGKGDGKQENAASTSQSEAPVSGNNEGAPTAPQKVQAKDLGALVDLIVASAGDLPRAEFDPAALAKSLGNDPQKLFEWVRDRTWWAPYRGLLRGAKGVMLDRVGSSLDRVVLLGELMRRAGYTVRLAHAQLPEARARELLGKLRPIPDERRSPIAPKPVSADRQRAIEAIMPGHERSLQEQVAESKRRSDDAKALVRSQADQLLSAVKDVAARARAKDDKAATAALQDHWWVEREEEGNWIAMDVLLPDAKMGNALVADSEISEWRAADVAPSIPETNWHTVQIRVVVERYQGGAATEFTLLETTIRPVDVLERPIALMHVPRPWPDVMPDPNADPNALRNTALWVSEWLPFLQVGDEIIAQSAFTDGGDLKSVSKDSVAGLGRSSGGGFFGSALGEGEDVESFATAEWIDYEIRVPGASIQRLRRPVFDLLGPARRSARAAGFEANTDARKLERFKALWSRTDILLQPCDFTAGFVAHLMSRSIVANQAAIRELTQERDAAKARSLALTILERIDMWGPLPNLVQWRSALGGRSGDWFVDRPNVLNYRVSQPVVDADGVAPRELIDIASNATGVRWAASQSSFEVSLRQGVSDTVAEMLALGGDLRAAENTASVFAMAVAGPGRGMLIEPRDTDSVRKLGWPADAAARLAADIDAGFLAVVLKEPVTLREYQRVGWWRVDPTSGETIGVMDTGYHQALTDDQINRGENMRRTLFRWRVDQDHSRMAAIRSRIARNRPVSDSARADLELYDLAEKLLTNLWNLRYL